MINFKKICRILLLAAFVCTLSGVALAENKTGDKAAENKNPRVYLMPDEKTGKMKQVDLATYWKYVDSMSQKLQKQTDILAEKIKKSYDSNPSVKAKIDAGYDRFIAKHPKAISYTSLDDYIRGISINEGANKGLIEDITSGSFSKFKADPNAAYNGLGSLNGIAASLYDENYGGTPKDPEVSSGTNMQQSNAAVTGCSSDYGLFSGLITTGRKIFKNLRDLIYVVAGFGIIGVAVGGFFGNLNWKWLGAIVIALVVIASTGEIINMITGCENFTKAMITDTLIHQ